MKKSGYFLLIIGFSLTLVACVSGAPQGDIKPESNVVLNVNPEELNEMLSTKDFIMVNVHIPFEGDIPGTDLFIPYNQISQYLDELPNDKKSKIVVYCRSGSMSNIAAEELISFGFTNIINLEGGFNAWTVAGFPLE
jgi:rhodanese-related sulfurtransferase